MGAVRIPISPFGGIYPRTSERLLADNAAQIAVNCRMSSGELLPLNEPSKVYTSAKTGPLLNIYRTAESGSYAWLTWPYDVDVVKAPLYGTAKWCYTGDAEPRITNMAMAIAGGGDNYPASGYVLGTPKPITAPTVVPSGGVGSNVDRYYGYSFYAIWDGLELEGAVSPLSTLTTGKVDATWAITAMDATPLNSGDITALTYVGSSVTITTTSTHFNRALEEIIIAGITTVANVNGTWKLTAADSVAKTMTFTVTTAPTGAYNNATDTTDTWTRKAAFAGTVKKKLYRTTGTAGQFQLVADAITATTYNDTLTDSQIPGNELISTDWDMPPADLQGLFLLPSNAMCGISGSKLCFSEPSQPHAWPTKYQLATNFPIVAAESFGSGIGVATTSTPYIVNGVTPGQMSMDDWKEVLPCQSKRSMVSLGNAVLYAAPQGMVALNGSGATIWSLQWFTDQEWKNYNPATMVSALAGRRLYVRHTKDAVTWLLIFNLLGDDQNLTEAYVSADDIYADSTDGRLYLSSGSDIYEFDPVTGAPMNQDWMSKEIVLPAPSNMGAAKVNFVAAVSASQAAAIQAQIDAVIAANAALVASGDVKGAWNSSGWNVRCWAGSAIAAIPEQPNKVTFMLYVDGAIKASRTLTNGRVFALPSGYKADNVAVRVTSKCRIKSVELGGTPSDLRQA